MRSSRYILAHVQNRCDALLTNPGQTGEFPAMNTLEKPWPFGLDRHNWPWFAAGFALVIAVVVWGDAAISRYTTAWPVETRAIYDEITRWGESDWILIPSLALLILFALLGLVMWRRIYRLAFFQAAGIVGFIFVGVGLPGLVSNLVKRAVGRARPVLIDSEGPLSLFHSFSNNWQFESFPSGHTTTAFAFACVVGFLAPRFFPVALVGAAAIAFSRLPVGMHYPTDVLGGVVFGVIGAYGVRYFYASRRWVFQQRPDGTITRRKPVALQRVLRKRR